MGQLADDMPDSFCENFGADVLPALLNSLGDEVPRVQAHACAALTNFCEHAKKELLVPQAQAMTEKFCFIMQNGISMAKENAATALANMVEVIEGEFMPFFNNTIHFMIGMLSTYY
jgi:hypothetical protein